MYINILPTYSNQVVSSLQLQVWHQFQQLYGVLSGIWPGLSAKVKKKLFLLLFSLSLRKCPHLKISLGSDSVLSKQDQLVHEGKLQHIYSDPEKKIHLGLNNNAIKLIPSC